jgi:hypothetical protein
MRIFFKLKIRYLYIGKKDINGEITTKSWLVIPFMKYDIEIESTQAFVRLRRLKNKGDI